MTLDKESGPRNLSDRDPRVWGTRNANRQGKGSLRAQRTLSVVRNILSASEMASPKTLCRGTLARVEMGIAVMGVTVAWEGVFNAFLLVYRLSRIWVWW